MTKRKTIPLTLLTILLLIWKFNSFSTESANAPSSIVKVQTAEVRAANKETIKIILSSKNISLDEIESFGYGAIPILTELYREADDNQDKYNIAWVFWNLGWKSREIEQALMPDLDSDDASLKVSAQWGIAKSTGNSEVITKLLYNLKNDSSAYVRDKAACALASDFVHISPTQRITILRGLIDGLNSETIQIRASSIQALRIQTGQTKRFIASADVNSRIQAINDWEQWLNEYERNL